jgi:formate/nitrite transporter FocA (FNT family)
LSLGVTRLLGGLVFCLGLILVIVLLIYLSGHLMPNEGAVGLHAIKIANAKTSLPFIEAVVRGI